VKLLHFADLHLDAPFAWARPETARLRRRNRRETLTRILELAAAEQVDAVLCAGDLFEHERFSADLLEFLRASFARTDRRIFLAPGNHDWYSDRSPYALVEWPANVHVFTEGRFTPVDLAAGLTLWGAAHRAPANTGDLFSDFRVDRPGVHIAVAHASESGALPFQESGKQPHAPFEAGEIAASGLAHAFLGHYHVARDGDRHTYPGNPDPLEFGESPGRGVVLATVSEDGAVTRERRNVAVSEVHDIEVALDGCEHSDDVRARLEAALAGLAGSVRATLVGELGPRVEVDVRDLRTLGAHLDGFLLNPGKLRVGYDLEEIAAQPTVRGQFVRDAGELADEERRRRVMLTGLRALDGRRDLEVV